MTTTSDRKAHARSLFAGIAGDYDRWAQVLSFGQDRRWHDLMIDAIAPAASGEDAVVADVATGTAAVAIALARRYPRCRVVGIDQSPEMLAGGARRVEAAGLRGRIELVEGQAERPPVEPGSVDALTRGRATGYGALAALALPRMSLTGGNLMPQMSVEHCSELSTVMLAGTSPGPRAARRS